MKTVLTVDDSRVVRSMVTKHLGPYQCQVLEAVNGQEGVAAAKRHRPDLILLDVTMPVMDGREALAELRRDAACKSIPVIMLTAESGRDTVAELVKLGIAGYIVKPFQKELFDKQVSKVLGGPIDRQAVLVIDDSERVLTAAREALEGTMKVFTAGAANEGVERYREVRPGVVVIDLAMPDVDGVGALAEIRKLGDSVYVALTVRGDSAAREIAKRAGFHFAVEKPFEAQDLLEQVMLAASSGGSPDDLANMCVGEEDGCPVITVPDPRSKVYGRVVSGLGKKLRALAEDGRNRLIIDIGRIGEVSSDVVNCLAQLLSDAATLGMRTAVASPDEKVIGGLKQIAEMRGALYASSRKAAREQLQ